MVPAVSKTMRLPPKFSVFGCATRPRNSTTPASPGMEFVTFLDTATTSGSAGDTAMVPAMNWLPMFTRPSSVIDGRASFASSRVPSSPT